MLPSMIERQLFELGADCIIPSVQPGHVAKCAHHLDDFFGGEMLFQFIKIFIAYRIGHLDGTLRKV